MELLQNIEAATDDGRAISVLYARLRATRGAAERSSVLRQIGECADALGQRLRQLSEERARIGTPAEIRPALTRLSEAMEQVMVQEREYRMACGAPADASDAAAGSGAP